MKKVRRVIALVGVIALVALYVSTLVLALIGSENTMNLFWADIVATIVLPVLIWAYTFIYNLLKEHYSPEAREETEKMREAMKDKEAAEKKQQSKSDKKSSGD